MGAPSLSAFLSLSAVVVLFVGYFLTVQVYVLRAEVAIGAISLVLLSGQLLFGTMAGLRFGATRRDKTLLSVSALLDVGCLTMVVTMIFLEVDFETLRRVCISAVFLAIGGVGLAVISCCRVLVGADEGDHIDN